jgi:hypothetical protein
MCFFSKKHLTLSLQSVRLPLEKKTTRRCKMHTKKETAQINTMSYMTLVYGQDWDTDIDPDQNQKAWEDLDWVFSDELDDSDWKKVRESETVWASYHEIDGKLYAIGGQEPTSNSEARLFMVEVS